MASEINGGELVRTSMVDAHGVVVRFDVVVAIIVKLASALASIPYDDDQMREGEVKGGWVVASHGRA